MTSTLHGREHNDVQLPSALKNPASAFAPPDPSYPPGPTGGGFGGALRDVAGDLLGLYTRLARDYGDFVPVRFGVRRGVFINHPDYIEDVLVTHSQHYIKSQALRRSRRLLGNGLLTSEGDFWRRQRRLAQPAFHRQRVATYGDTMVASTSRMLDGWRDGERRDLHAEMMTLTLDIVSRTLFGADVGDSAREVGEAVTVAQERFSRRVSSWLFFLPETIPTPGNQPFLRAARRLDALIYRIIADRRAERARGEDRGDLLSLLLAAHDDDGSGMTDEQLRDECMTIFLAGHETTALALTWTLFLLSRNPDAEAALHAEVDAVLGDRAPTVADLPALRVVEATVNEGMRLYPPAYTIGREATQDTQIGPYTVPKGMLVLMSQWTMHRDERYFEDPLAFRPQRWLDGLQKRLPRFAYFPFGGGPRLCIGHSFAQMEASLLLAAIAQRYRLRVVPGFEPTLRPAITLRPGSGMPVILERRAPLPAARAGAPEKVTGAAGSAGSAGATSTRAAA